MSPSRSAQMAQNGGFNPRHGNDGAAAPPAISAQPQAQAPNVQLPAPPPGHRWRPASAPPTSPPTYTSASPPFAAANPPPPGMRWVQRNQGPAPAPTPVMTGPVGTPAGARWVYNGAPPVPGVPVVAPAQTRSADPATSPDVPGINLQNSLGGTGLTPGYNYVFPTSHVNIHAIKGTKAPWQLPLYTAVDFHALTVPTSVTVKEFLTRMGANNEDAKKNVVTEIIKGANGKWNKGVSVNAGEKDATKKTLDDMGWTDKRTGKKGDGPVVWVWITKA